MTLLIADIKSRLAYLLNDEDMDFWDDTHFTDSLNEAQIAIMRLLATSLRPGRGVSAAVTLSGSAKQFLPADAYRMIRVIGNVGGRAVTMKTFEELAVIDPCWQTASPIQGAEHYAYDPSISNEFWIYPGAATGAVAVNYIKKPATLTPAATELDVDDEYLNDVINYCLFRAYQREGVEAKWVSYRQAFYSGLMQKLNIDEKDMAYAERENS